MDISILATVRKFLIAGLLFAALFLAPDRAAAQLGACPAAFASLGNVSGFYPDDLLVCSHSFFAVSERDDPNDRFPCDQLVAVDDFGFPPPPGPNVPGGGYQVVIVPDAAMYYGQIARLRFFINPTGANLIPPGNNLWGVEFDVNYVNSNGNWTAQEIFEINDFPSVAAFYTSTGINWFYQVHVIDVTIQTAEGSGGYFMVALRYDDDDLPRSDWYLSSFQLGAAADYLPAQCPIPNANTPATAPAPTVQGTAAPTWTPHSTPTPITTAGATAVGGTPVSTPSPTPWTFPTLASESTPTPWPPYTLPTIAWPTPDLTVVPAAATAENVSGNILGEVNSLLSDWQQVIDFTDQNSDMTVTGTTGIEPPNTTVQRMISGISLPISYLKGVGSIMPNSWPYILAFLGFAAWVGLMYAMQYMIQAVIFVFELIRKLWEMVPFN